MRTNSIVYKMASRLTIILLILLTILVTSNVYSLNVVQTNYYTSSQHTLNLYRVTIQNYLDNVSRDLLEVFETHADMSYNILKEDETGLYFKSLELKHTLMAKMSHDSSSDAMFIKSEQHDFHVFYFGSRINSVNKLNLSDTLRLKDFNRDKSNHYGQWQYVVVDSDVYIYKTITYNDMTFGTLINTTTLFTILNIQQQTDIHYFIEYLDYTLLAAVNGDNISFDEAVKSEENNDYLVTQEELPLLGKLIAVVEKKLIFSGLQAIHWFIVGLAILAIIVVPVVIRSLSLEIIKPILELSKAAKEVEKGSNQFKQPSQLYSMEFLKLFHAFQSMVNEIRALKIQAYEEELEKKRLQLDYLQLQIRPHFYLNAISTITSLTYNNKNEEIRSFIEHLSHYLRYMFNRNLKLVTLQEEVKQASSFIQMQEVRYPNQIFFMCDIEEGLEEERVPNFITLTFVENAFKHAMFYEKVLSIFIKASKVIRDQVPYIYIVIEDNGKGFSDQVLAAYEVSAQSNQSNQLTQSAQSTLSTQLAQESDTEGYHIGILNIKRTLEIIYKRQDLLFLSNHEQLGAKVEIWIPAMINDEGR